MEREYQKTITLSHDHANKLVCYLLMTTNYRKGEREAWEKLAAEKEEDGTPQLSQSPKQRGLLGRTGPRFRSDPQGH